MAPWANGLAAFGGGLPPSRATREQDAAGAGALNCFHHHVGRRKIAGCRQGSSRCALITAEPAAVPDSAAIEMLSDPANVDHNVRSACHRPVIFGNDTMTGAQDEPV